MTGFLSQFNAFHDMAAKATSLDDFGADDYQEPMRLMLSDYDKHMHFNPLGTGMISGEIIGRLVGRLMTQQGLESHPVATHAEIVKPLVIIGMARTGTTTLQRLMLQDPGMQALPMWLGCAPMPRPPRETWESNPYYQQVAQGLEQVFTLDPELRTLHPMAAGDPDECRFAFNHSFWAPECPMTANVPTYFEWALNSDARYAYQYYRRVLGLIADGDSRRWLLKDVNHLFGLDALLKVFPDACIVQTHRDPVTAMTSAASLIYHIRKMREVNLTPLQHGKLTLKTWASALKKFEKIRQQHNPGQFIDIHNDDIQADPVATLERIYDHFGLPVTEVARKAWGALVKADPRGGHGAHHYRPEDFGFSSKLVDAAVGDYYTRYQNVEKFSASKAH